MDMDTEVRQLKQSFGKAVLWILFLLVVATGTTYAWFTLSGLASTNVTPMAGTISKGSSALLISSNQTGPFEKTCELVLDANPESLKPLSTPDLEHFYRSIAQNKEGITVLYENADNRVKQEAVHGIVYLKCENADCDVYFNREELNLGSDAQALAAMRLGMKITSHSGTETFLWKLDELGSTGSAQSVQTISRTNAVVSSISQSGQPVYIDDPAKNIGDYMIRAGSGSDEFSAGNQKVVSLNADEVAKVEFWLYLEGCDEQCSNPVQNRNSEIKLAFAGVGTK